MSLIRIVLDDRVSDPLEGSPEQIERSALEIIVLERYRRRELSVERAAVLLGLDQLSCIRWSGALGVPLFDMITEEWEQERHVIEPM